MSRWDSYLQTGKSIIEAYDGNIPLSIWLKDFFRQHKKMGSTDRKIVSELVYSFFRTGHATKDTLVEERLLAGLFLCSQVSNDLLNYFKPAWNEVLHLPLPEKIKACQKVSGDIQLNNIFPWKQELSDGIDASLFNESFLQQPDLFIRIRPGRDTIVNQKLAHAGIPFTRMPGTCIRLPNATKLDEIIELDKEAVIQDYNSQRLGDFFSWGQTLPGSRRPRVWDCCAASGGKSIMAFDIEPSIDLTVSDVRKSILVNLEKRFQKAGIKEYHSFIADLSDTQSPFSNAAYELIIADVPCTGSGTWARTPEQLYFFDAKRIDYYNNLQKKILGNVIPKLSAGGRLVYITCSVFKKENEEVAGFIEKQFGLELIQMQLLKGYEMKADSMFVAVFEKN